MRDDWFKDYPRIIGHRFVPGPQDSCTHPQTSSGPRSSSGPSSRPGLLRPSAGWSGADGDCPGKEEVPDMANYRDFIFVGHLRLCGLLFDH